MRKTGPVSNPAVLEADPDSDILPPLPEGGLLTGAALQRGEAIVAMLDEGGRLLSGNASAARLAGVFAQPPMRRSLAAATFKAIEAGRLIQETVEAPGADGVTAYDLLLLPQADGVLMIATDKTLDASLRTALIDSRARYKDLVELSDSFAWETNADGVFVFVSPKGAVGWTARDMVGQPIANLLSDERNPSPLLPFGTPTRLDDYEVWMSRPDGGDACLLVTAVPLYDSEGNWRGARGVGRDISDQRQRDRALAHVLNRERVFSRIMRTFRSEVDPANMLHVAASTTAHGMAASGCQIFAAREMGPGITGDVFDVTAGFGTNPGEAAVSRALAQLRQDGVLETEVDGWSLLAAPSGYRDRRNGAVFLWRSPGRPDWEEDDRLLIVHLANQIGIAIEQIVNHERLVQVSRTDGMTGLLNRRAFYEELKRRFARLSRGHSHGALIYVDLDNFKLVNDTHGHARGDEALLMMRDILHRNTRGTDLVGRLGGDEFAVWLDGADVEIAEKRAKVFLGAGAALRGYSGSADKPLGMSLGIAVYDPDRPEDLNTFITRADQAMYNVKRGGKSHYAIAPGAAE